MENKSTKILGEKKYRVYDPSSNKMYTLEDDIKFDGLIVGVNEVTKEKKELTAGSLFYMLLIARDKDMNDVYEFDIISSPKVRYPLLVFRYGETRLPGARALIYDNKEGIIIEGDDFPLLEVLPFKKIGNIFTMKDILKVQYGVEKDKSRT